jgi:MtfA peptidase
LLLHRDTDYFPNLASITVYPHEYQGTLVTRDEAGVVHEREVTWFGESWMAGTVVMGT